ncbi:MAG: sigma-70 family RNA polymerase sigma factor [Oscillospiraceae bacterium]|nr:sigma-70 family RNA polymerase sigma factor [Oscillospiraceae bacterium]
MEDAAILALYWRRDEQAIRETEARYGAYCRSVARRILPDPQDAEEVLSDTWLRAWESIPPKRPERLATYLGKLTRDLAISRLRQLSAQKRGGGQLPLVLEELSECLAAPGSPEQELEARELRQALDRFVSGLAARERDVFVCRYWFLAPLEELSRRTGYSQSKLKSMLARTRKKLDRYLREEGYR